MLRRIVGVIVKHSLVPNRSDTRLAEFPDCTINLKYVIFINGMNVFLSSHRFTVTIMDITSAVYTGNIDSSSMVSIYYTMTITTPTIFSTSTMIFRIDVLGARIVREKTITSIFLAFASIIMIRVTLINLFRSQMLCFLHKQECQLKQANNHSFKIFILILKIPKNPNGVVFGIGIIIFHQLRVFEIILCFLFIVILIVIKIFFN